MILLRIFYVTHCLGTPALWLRPHLCCPQRSTLSPTSDSGKFRNALNFWRKFQEHRKMDLRDTMTQTIRERRGALAVTVASRQRAPMRSRNYLLHIVDAIVSHLSFNQPHVSFRDRAFLRSTALAHMTILPLEQRRP